MLHFAHADLELKTANSSAALLKGSFSSGRSSPNSADTLHTGKDGKVGGKADAFLTDEHELDDPEAKDNLAGDYAMTVMLYGICHASVMHLSCISAHACILHDANLRKSNHH